MALQQSNKRKLTSQTAIFNYFTKKGKSETSECSSVPSNRNSAVVTDQKDKITRPEAPSAVITPTPAPHEKDTDDNLQVIYTIPSDLSDKDEPRKLPPRNFMFPQRKLDKARSFSHNHLLNYEYLEYSVERDAVYCKWCRHLSKVESNWSHSGFSDWKEFTRSVKKHEDSKRHKVCKEEYQSYMMTKRASSGTVKDQIFDPDTINAKKLASDSEHFNLVIECLLFLTRQDIALRGHREDEESPNKGNFLELHKFLISHDQHLRELYEKVSVKRLSPHVQNLILEAAANAAIELIKLELKSNEAYAILADGTRDRNHEEVEAVVIRYFYNGQIMERVVGFADISKDQSAEGCAKAVLNLLKPLDLIYTNCVGMSFDGAPVMSGHKGGVQAILRKTFVNAVFVHCSSHRLNLVLQKISANCREADECLTICNKLYVYFSQPKHAAALKSVQNETR